MAERTKATHKATVVAKVIRADGTEQTFVSEDVTVKDAKALEQQLAAATKKGDG